MSSDHQERFLSSQTGARRPLGEAPPRILVAEDDADMRRIVVEALRKDGYEVGEAADGGQLMVALATDPEYCRGKLDLIITDVRMPVFGGLQIVQVLRETNCFVPIILMTAFGDRRLREEAAKLDAVIFDKPFELGDLRATVTGLLDTAARR